MGKGSSRVLALSSRNRKVPRETRHRCESHVPRSARSSRSCGPYPLPAMTTYGCAALVSRHRAAAAEPKIGRSDGWRCRFILDLGVLDDHEAQRAVSIEGDLRADLSS